MPVRLFLALAPLCLLACSDSSGGPSDGATMGGDDGGVVMTSGGCGKALTLATGSWVAQQLSVGGTTRDYFVWLPAGYDPARAYPVVYQFHGCSSGANRQDNNVPLQTQSKGDAIVVRGKATGDCWDTNKSGPDVAFFDALVPAIEESFCTDAQKRFAVGYSSGSFMTHLLACVRGNQLRGVASIAGGQAGNACTGDPAALLIHDDGDPTVNISASVAARDDHAKRNGCDVAAARTATLDPPCEAYAGCTAGKPVVWCQTSGKGHDRQDALAAPVFWKFLSSL